MTIHLTLDESAVAAIVAGAKPANNRGKAKLETRCLRRDESGERIVIYLPEELVTELRVFCATQRRSLSHAATEAIEKLLASRNSKDLKKGDS